MNRPAYLSAAEAVERLGISLRTMRRRTAAESLGMPVATLADLPTL